MVTHLQNKQGKWDANGDAELAGKNATVMWMPLCSQITHIAAQQSSDSCIALPVMTIIKHISSALRGLSGRTWQS